MARQHATVDQDRGEEIEIAKDWANRKGEAIITKLVEFKGRWFIDVRRHYTNKDGRFAPTPKGLMLPVRKIVNLAKAVTKAEAEARSRGMISDGSEE